MGFVIWVRINAGKRGKVPDFVFLAHVVDVTSSMHASFVSRFFASRPFVTKLSLLPQWPIAFIVMLLMWGRSKTFLYSFYNLRGWLHQTWVVPRFGFQVFNLPFILKMLINLVGYYLLITIIMFLVVVVVLVVNLWQYFLPFAREGINKHIEDAILRADKLGVKVISLAALNKVGAAVCLYFFCKKF